MMSVHDPRAVQHLEIDTRDQFDRWKDYISMAVRVAVGLLAAAGLYYRLDSRLTLIEYRVETQEKTLDRHANTDERLQSELDEIMRYEAAESAVHNGRDPDPPVPKPAPIAPGPSTVEDRRKRPRIAE